MLEGHNLVGNYAPLRRLRVMKIARVPLEPGDDGVAFAKGGSS